jgi:hypothetical protein
MGDDQVYWIRQGDFMGWDFDPSDDFCGVYEGRFFEFVRNNEEIPESVKAKNEDGEFDICERTKDTLCAIRLWHESRLANSISMTLEFDDIFDYCPNGFWNPESDNSPPQFHDEAHFQSALEDCERSLFGATIKEILVAVF